MTYSKLIAVILVGSAALATGCASTETGESTYAKAEVANPDEVTCRTIIKTGTRIGTKVCKTNRAWASGNSQGRNMAEDIQRRAYQSVGDPNAGN